MTTQVEPRFLYGYEALGFPVPVERLTCGLHALREIAPQLSTEQALRLVGRVAVELERGEPWRAKQEAMWTLGVDGAFQLLAALLAATPQEVREP